MSKNVNRINAEMNSDINLLGIEEEVDNVYWDITSQENDWNSNIDPEDALWAEVQYLPEHRGKYYFGAQWGKTEIPDWAIEARVYGWTPKVIADYYALPLKAAK